MNFPESMTLMDWFAGQKLASGATAGVAYQAAAAMMRERERYLEPAQPEKLGDYHLNRDGSVAIDPHVSYYPMDSCPMRLKVQLHTLGGVAAMGMLTHPDQGQDYLGWRPLPKGTANVG